MASPRRTSAPKKTSSSTKSRAVPQKKTVKKAADRQLKPLVREPGEFQPRDPRLTRGIENPFMLNAQSWDKDKVMQHVCQQLSVTTKSLLTILRLGCNGHGLPEAVQVRKWVREDVELASRYARAKELQAEFMAEEILEIADDGSNDFMKTEKGVQLRDEHVQRSRLRIDSRKWLLAKLQPKKYGDKIAVGGAEDLPPIKVADLQSMSVEELRALAAKLEEAGVSDGE